MLNWKQSLVYHSINNPAFDEFTHEINMFTAFPLTTRLLANLISKRKFFELLQTADFFSNWMESRIFEMWSQTHSPVVCCVSHNNTFNIFEFMNGIYHFMKSNTKYLRIHVIWKINTKGFVCLLSLIAILQ